MRIRYMAFDLTFCALMFVFDGHIYARNEPYTNSWNQPPLVSRRGTQVNYRILLKRGLSVRQRCIVRRSILWSASSEMRICFIRAKRVSNWYIPKKMFARVPVCSTNLGFSVEDTNLGFSVGYVLCASYVCTWYQPADHSMVPGTYVQYRATSKRT